MKADIVIYHANCVDGFTAAWVAWRRWPTAEFVAAQYGDEPPDVTGRAVLIVDFSYPRDVLLRMRDQASEVLVLDHHKTAHESLDGLEFCVFDMARSGAGLAWDHLSKGHRPALVNYVEDRDLWKWNLEDSREVSAYIALCEKDFEVWETLHRDTSEHLPYVVSCGTTALRVTEQYVEAKKMQAGRICLGGQVVPCINTTWAVSETVGALAEGAPFAVGWFQRTDGKFVYSLRSRGDGVDVSEVARIYGGGGHKGAAGFTLDELLPVVSEV